MFSNDTIFKYGRVSLQKNDECGDSVKKFKAVKQIKNKHLDFFPLSKKEETNKNTFQIM